MNETSNKVVVCFYDPEGRTTGDSALDPAITIPYVEGMTIEQVRHTYLTKLMNSWDGGDDINEFIEEYDINISGGWVIDKKFHDILLSGDWDVGSDSALYRMIHMVKSQIQAASEFIIE